MTVNIVHIVLNFLCDSFPNANAENYSVILSKKLTRILIKIIYILIIIIYKLSIYKEYFLKFGVNVTFKFFKYEISDMWDIWLSERSKNSKSILLLRCSIDLMLLPVNCV